MYLKLLTLFPQRGVLFERKKGFVHWLICHYQSKYTKTKHGVESLFGHIRLICDGYVYESTIRTEGKRKIFGVIKTRVEKVVERMTLDIKKYKLIGFQSEFDLTDDEWKIIMNKAEELVREKVSYAGHELIGTAKRIKKWKKADDAERVILMQSPNDYDTNAEYCIAAIILMIESVREYVTAHRSNSIVDMPWIEPLIPCISRLYNIKNLISHFLS